MSTTTAKELLNNVHANAVFGRRVEVLADALALAMPRDIRVLDVGCGDGSVAAAVMARRPDVRIDGVDVLIRPHTMIPVRRFDGDVLPFDRGSYDVVTLVDVLHHCPDPAQSLAEAARVAGRAVVVKDHLVAGPLARPTLRAMDWFGNRGHGVVLPYNYLDDAGWRDAADHAGLLEVDRRTRLGLYPRPFSWVFDRRLHLVSVYEHTAAPAR